MIGTSGAPLAAASTETKDLPPNQYDIRNVTSINYIEIAFQYDQPTFTDVRTPIIDIAYPTNELSIIFAYDRARSQRTMTIGVETWSIVRFPPSARNPPNAEINILPLALVCPELQNTQGSSYLQLLVNENQTMGYPSAAPSIAGALPAFFHFQLGVFSNPDVRDTTMLNPNYIQPVFGSQQIRSVSLRLFVRVNYEPNKIPVFGPVAQTNMQRRDMEAFIKSEVLGGPIGEATDYAEADAEPTQITNEIAQLGQGDVEGETAIAKAVRLFSDQVTQEPLYMEGGPSGSSLSNMARGSADIGSGGTNVFVGGLGGGGGVGGRGGRFGGNTPGAPPIPPNTMSPEMIQKLRDDLMRAGVDAGKAAVIAALEAEKVKVQPGSDERSAPDMDLDSSRRSLAAGLRGTGGASASPMDLDIPIPEKATYRDVGTDPHAWARTVSTQAKWPGVGVQTETPPQMRSAPVDPMEEFLGRPFRAGVVPPMKAMRQNVVPKAGGAPPPPPPPPPPAEQATPQLMSVDRTGRKMKQRTVPPLPSQAQLRQGLDEAIDKQKQGDLPMDGDDGSAGGGAGGPGSVLPVYGPSKEKEPQFGTPKELALESGLMQPGIVLGLEEEQDAKRRAFGEKTVTFSPRAWEIADAAQAAGDTPLEELPPSTPKPTRGRSVSRGAEGGGQRPRSASSKRSRSELEATGSMGLRGFLNHPDTQNQPVNEEQMIAMRQAAHQLGAELGASATSPLTLANQTLQEQHPSKRSASQKPGSKGPTPTPKEITFQQLITRGYAEFHRTVAPNDPEYGAKLNAMLKRVEEEWKKKKKGGK